MDLLRLEGICALGVRQGGVATHPGWSLGAEHRSLGDCSFHGAMRPRQLWGSASKIPEPPERISEGLGTKPQGPTSLGSVWGWCPPRKLLILEEPDGPRQVGWQAIPVHVKTQQMIST